MSFAIGARGGDGDAAVDRRRTTNEPILKRGVLLGLVERIVVDERHIEIAIRPDFLTLPVPTPAVPADRGAPTTTTASPSVSISRPLDIRRRGREIRLLFDGPGTSEAQPDDALIKAVAQAHRWWQDLLDRRYGTLRAIAFAYSTHERYVSAVLKLAFLPPALSAAILNGTQPPEFTLHRALTTAS